MTTNDRVRAIMSELYPVAPLTHDLPDVTARIAAYIKDAERQAVAMERARVLGLVRKVKARIGDSE